MFTSTCGVCHSPITDKSNLIDVSSMGVIYARLCVGCESSKDKILDCGDKPELGLTPQCTIDDVGVCTKCTANHI